MKPIVQCWATICFFSRLVWSNDDTTGHAGESQDLNSGARKIFELPADYDTEMPPLRKKGEPIRVSLSLFLREISDVIEERSEVKMYFHVMVYWQEERLVLVDAEYFESEDALMLDPKSLSRFWLPDIYITNMKSLEATSFLEKIESIMIFGNKTIRYSIAGEATVVCPMDFVLYPLDVQSCHLDFTSYSFGKKIMLFEWRNNDAIKFATIWDHLPYFEVQMKAEMANTSVYWENVEFSSARLYLVLRRRLSYYVLQTYIPSALFVFISWISFIVPPEVVPGRMVLLVTTLLTLVTMYEAVRTRSPPAQGVKCIEVWIIACIGFVFFALLEYAFCFYISTYLHKSKLRKSKKCPQSRQKSRGPRLVVSPLWIRKTRLAMVQLRNRFGPVVTNPLFKRQVATVSPVSEEFENSAIENAPQKEPAYLETLDRLSLGLFPTGFLLFNVAYWLAYVRQSQSINVYST